MLGRDIPFEIKDTPKTAKMTQMIYLHELIPRETLKIRPKRPPSPVRMGMDKIRAKTTLGKFLVEFFSSSTIHGLNHMTAPRRHIIERFLALTFIAGALAGLILLSLTFWQRYQDAAIVIVLDHEYRRFGIKAPAIVICPTERIDEKLFPKVFAKYGLEDTVEARKFFSFISNASYLTFNETPDFNAIDPKEWLPILDELKPQVELSTTSGLQPTWIVTERGFCLTINNDVSLYSSVNYWWNNNWTVIHASLSPAYTYQKHEINEQIRVKTHDVMFSIHSSSDVVNFQEKFYTCKRMTMVTVEVVVVEVSSSHHVAELSLRQRKCKFSTEGGLKMWPIYSSNMCRLECRYQRILRFCHCYPHFARPTPGIRICDAAGLRCITANWASIFLSNRKAAEECGCTADCNNARYVEASFSTFALKKGSPADAVMTPAVIFPTDKFVRAQIFGFNDFLASVGGAAGLLLGASIISFIEIFYFATLRLYWFKNEILRLKKWKSRVL